MERAIIDRIVDDRQAVLLVGSGEREFIVDKASLPKEAREGDWLRVTLEGGAITAMELEPGGQEAKEELSSRLNRLKAKGGSKFKMD